MTTTRPAEAAPGFDFAAIMEWSCAGKVAHPSFAAAQQRVARERARHKLPSRQIGSLQIYRCRTCRQWHLGTGGR